jgi:glycosyltransferase involved in cell wall biosynthesis
VEQESCQLVDSTSSKSRPIRLLLDGRKLGDGGIGVYIENAIVGLLQTGSVDITVIGTQAASTCYEWAGSVDWIFSSARQYSFREYFLLARGIDFSHFDIFHAPHYTLPFGIPIPTVVTVHDLIHVTHPQAFYYPIVARRLIASAVRRSRFVIAVSEATRRGIVSEFGVEQERVVCIPNAVSPYLMREGDLFRVRNSDAPYFVSVLSNTKPHKGVEDLLSAYAVFRREFFERQQDRECPKLLLAGYGAEALRASNDDVFAEGVEVCGAVETSVLRQLYRGASALIVPSFAEGFCLPAVEAQSLGTRVLCRPVGALQELVSNDDVVTEDFSIEAFVAGMHNICSRTDVDPAARHKHLEKFSLATTSAKLCALYRRVTGV